MNRRAAFLLPLTLLAFSGCLGGGSSPAPQESEDEHAHDHDMMDGHDHSTHAHGPLTKKVQGDVWVSAASTLRTVNVGGAYSYPLAVEANTTGFVLELVWSPALPGADRLALWVAPAGTALDADKLVEPPPAYAKVAGASPLRLPVDARNLPRATTVEVLVRAAGEPAGVALQQAFTLHVSTFADMPFDEAYAAPG